MVKWCLFNQIHFEYRKKRKVINDLKLIHTKLGKLRFLKRVSKELHFLYHLLDINIQP